MLSAMALAVRKAYGEGQDDETMEPLVLWEGNRPAGRITPGDAVIFYNIRGERESELTKSFVRADFSFFPTVGATVLPFATMIEYEKGLPVDVAFPPEGEVRDTLCEVLSARGLRQVKITEAEKAIHVAFFLNGKRSEPFPGEERIVVPTRKDVALFDEAPEMSIAAIARETVHAVHDSSRDFIFTNFPNVDVVGHIENEGAILRAVEAVDTHMGIVIEEALREGMTVIVTADHGTAEQWLYPDGQIDTGHTASPVPFILARHGSRDALRPGGDLCDIAPTVLELLGIAPPPAMTGTSLLLGGTRSDLKRRAPRLLLLLLDGWGENPNAYGNLIARARTPVMDRLKRDYPCAILTASGEAVGLPPGTVGNSEAGHLHIGAGRRIYADRVRIARAIVDGSFFANPAFLRAIRTARNRGTALHLMGIVSFFSSHGSLDHLFALMELARREGMNNVNIHAMLGRRGETPESGVRYIEAVADKARELGVGRVVSVIGRYWSMDREENWDRIEKTYRMLVYGEGTAVTT